MIAYVTTAEKEGFCSEGGKWVAICETHSTLINAATKKSLTNMSTEEFCECCMGICEECYNCQKPASI